MANTLISIVVPVYKAEQFLNKCIDSILAQTYTKWELLLVDDGSPDNSGAICDEYATKDTRIKVFHKINGGVSSARNCGIEKAIGKFLCFIDSDDCVSNTFLSDFCLENYNVDLYVQGYKIIKSDQIREIHKFEKNEELVTFIPFFIEAENKNIINSPVCKLFDNTIIVKNRIRFDINTSYGEDHIFVLTYLFYTNKIYISKTCSYYYIHHDNESLTRRNVPYQELVYYTKRIFELQNLLCKEQIGILDNSVYCIINTRLYSNILRTISNSFSADRCLMDYRIIKNEYNALNCNFRGIRIYQKLLLIILKDFPVYISYLIYKEIIKFKNGKNY